jgi:hypothetical protein
MEKFSLLKMACIIFGGLRGSGGCLACTDLHPAVQLRPD